MPYCNGADRGCACEAGWGNEKGFLLSLSGSWATSPCCQSRQTSLWSGVTRESLQQTSGGVADMSAAATLAGAAPSHGNMSCLLQVRIVEVSSGKRRRAESGRFDRAVVQFCCTGGQALPHGRIGSNGTPS